jgi:hypothetical protein
MSLCSLSSLAFILLKVIISSGKNVLIASPQSLHRITDTTIPIPSTATSSHLKELWKQFAFFFSVIFTLCGFDIPAQAGRLGSLRHYITPEGFLPEAKG